MDYISKVGDVAYLTTWEATSGFEPLMQLLQSRALPLGDVAWNGSGRRGSNPRLSPWQGDALPLSHSRVITTIPQYRYRDHVCMIKLPHRRRIVNSFWPSYWISKPRLRSSSITRSNLSC